MKRAWLLGKRYALILPACVIATLAFDFFVLLPAMPSFIREKESYQSSEAVLLDRNDEVIHVLRRDMSVRRLGWVGLAQVSPVMRKAVVRAEDRRFASHHGVDWLALSSALSKRLLSPGRSGASTITMQLASRIDPDLHPRKVRRTGIQKWRQMKAAMSLERSWTKDQILEAYLNLITFSGELTGIAAASEGIFGKLPSGLDANESLILASLIPSPKQDKERLAGRACRLGTSLGIPFDPKEIESMVSGRIGRPGIIRQPVALAPHVARELLKGGASRATCTLDKRLQEFALETLARIVGDLASKNVKDGAVLVADNATGEILAYVGNTGEPSSARYMDGVRSLRQAGSTLKPFLYGLAIEKRILTASSIVLDEPLKIMTSTGIYQPEDYNSAYLGPVSVRRALASSLNTPAVRTLKLLTCESFVTHLKHLKFESISEDPEYYGYSLALGTVDISLFELVQAYTAFPRSGLLAPLTLTPAEKGAPVRAMSPETAYIVTGILSDRESRSETFGLENYLSTRFFTAAKTGTSKDMRDNWCIGFSQRYTVGVWVGNFSGEPMWNVSGVSGAAPVWMEIMNHLHGSSPSAPPAPPAGAVRRRVSFDTGEQARDEWYIIGTEPGGKVSLAISHVRETISYPPDGATLALDPDIPEENQAVLLQAYPDKKSFYWIMDGRPIGRGGRLFWKPRPGVHTLTLTDKSSKILDKASFTVR